MHFVKPVIIALFYVIVFSAATYAENAMQCNQKLNSTLFGQSASQADLAIADPMARVDNMMKDRRFIEHFASFVNAHMDTRKR